MNRLASIPFVAKATSRASQQLPVAVGAVVRQLGGRYSVDGAVGQNLDADLPRVKNYLGTYLPRTVQEVHTIAAELLALPVVAGGLPKNRPLRVLDLGSGTGGAWLGLVYALAAGSNVKSVQVHAVDGNPIALAQQPAFVQPVQAETGLQIQLHRHEQRFAQQTRAYYTQLKQLLEQLGGLFDVVLVSKHWNEFYRHDFDAAQQMIAAGVDALSTSLHLQGYLLVLEPTDPVQEGGPYMPNLLAKELAHYWQRRPQGLQAIVPVPCALFAAGGCAGSSGFCFTQRQFKTSTAWQRTQTSNATYRVLTHPAQAAFVRAGYPAQQSYRVSVSRNGQEGVCLRGRRLEQAGAKDGFVPKAQYRHAA